MCIDLIKQHRIELIHFHILATPNLKARSHIEFTIRVETLLTSLALAHNIKHIVVSMLSSDITAVSIN